MQTIWSKKLNPKKHITKITYQAESVCVKNFFLYSNINLDFYLLF